MLMTILFICPVWHSVGQIFLFGRSSSHTRIVPLEKRNNQLETHLINASSLFCFLQSFEGEAERKRTRYYPIPPSLAGLPQLVTVTLSLLIDHGQKYFTDGEAETQRREVMAQDPRLVGEMLGAEVWASASLPRGVILAPALAQQEGK